MTKKIKILIGVCAVLVVGQTVVPAAASALKQHNDGFPDTFNDVVLHERVASFPTVADSHDRGDDILRAPDWAPRDATAVKIKADTTSQAQVMRFTLADTPLRHLEKRQQCDPGDDYEEPVLAADWGPKDAGPGRCGRTDGYTVMTKGSTVYAWRGEGPQ